MTLDKIFFGYMALVGLAVGAILVAYPSSADLLVKPYFWILIAVIAFDGLGFLRGGNAPGTMIGIPARLLGFVIGIVLMVAVPALADRR